MNLGTTTPRFLALALLALFCAACGGGGQSGDNSATVQASATVVFPTPLSMTDAPLVVVRGTATKSQQLAGVRVHGIPAHSDDGFATWSAEVPLDLGTTVLKVDLLTTDGERLAAVDSVTVQREVALLGVGVDLAFSEDGILGPEAWYLDLTKVLRQNQASSELEVVSGPDRGDGTTLEIPLAMTTDPTGERVYVLRHAASGLAIVEIDPYTGDRSELSGPNVGAGPSLEGATDLDYFHDRSLGGEDRLLVSLEDQAGLMFVDLSTGERVFEPLFGDVVDGAQRLDLFNDPELDAPRMAAITQDDKILAVDLWEERCYEVGSEEIGSGPLWEDHVADLAFTDRGEILVLTPVDEGIFLLDFMMQGYPRELRSPEVSFDGVSFHWYEAIDSLDTYAFDGMAVMASGQGMVGQLERGSDTWTGRLAPRIGSGSPLGDPVDMTAMEEGFLVSSWSTGQLLHLHGDGVRSAAVDWDDSERKPAELCFDEEGGRAYFFDLADDCVYMVDLESGHTERVSDAQQDVGAALGRVMGLEFHDDQQYLLALTRDEYWNAAVLEINALTGYRKLISGWGAGDGPEFGHAPDMTFDSADGRLCVLSLFENSDAEYGVIEVDLGSGARELLSGGDVGTGVQLRSARGMDYSSTREEFLVSTTHHGLVLVDAQTGHRELITSDSDLGSPPLVPTHLEWDPEREIVTTIDTRQQKLMNYDLVAGQWTTVAR